MNVTAGTALWSAFAGFPAMPPAPESPEAFGQRSDLDDSFAEARLFYTVYGVVLVIAAAIVLIPGAPLVKILYLTQALNAVLLLAILPFMRRLALDPAVMGAQILSERGRWITAAALAMIAVSVGALFVLTVF